MIRVLLNGSNTTNNMWNNIIYSAKLICDSLFSIFYTAMCCVVSIIFSNGVSNSCYIYFAVYSIIQLGLFFCSVVKSLSSRMHINSSCHYYDYTLHHSWLIVVLKILLSIFLISSLHVLLCNKYSRLTVG